MRLTLRALLNYMNGQLNPKDSEEIGKKIEESKFASELFHKIRDVMRRLRLAAPAVTERGANLDCNTVAEYLDNALPADRVPDFEEVSLKSEMHLAEVASCHQILTMVLCEPAEIDPESRQRMYQLPTATNLVDEERLAAVEAASTLSGDGRATAPPAPPTQVRPRPVVPEYLRDPPKPSRLLPAAAIMLLVGVAIGLLLLMLGQFNAGTPLGNVMQWTQAKMHGKSADDEDRDDADGKKPAKPSDREANTAAKDIGNSLIAAGKSEVPVPPAEKPLEKPAPENPPLAISDKAPEATATPSPAPGAPGQPLSVAPRSTTPENKPVSGDKSPLASVAGPDQKGTETEPKNLPGSPAAGTTLVKPPVEVAKIDSPLPTGALPKPGSTPPAVGPASPPPTAENKLKIGRFMSDGQDVLLKFEANRAGWRRVLPEEFLAGRQPLLALPSYRPRLVILNVGATLELINGTRIELLPDDAQDQPGVDIDFGRVVIKPLAQAGARLRVMVGSHAGTITLTNVESIAGLEVTRVHDPGADPEKVLSHAKTTLYVARGGAVWEEGEGKQPTRLTAPAELMLDGAEADTPSGTVKNMPKWITANTVNELDQRAALSVSQALPADRAASLGLMELTEARQKEIRWLAARCLGYLGQFDPMTAALNDVDFRREWPDYIDQLKEAIARGQETSAGIRQSLEKQYGNESAALYRMLWGYTDKDLEAGEDARLVKFLEHEAPVFRVLAFWNLKDITHQGLYYQPEATSATKRLQSVQRWRRQQQLGRIRFNVPEVKLRSAPAELPPKEPPAAPQPLDDVPPADVKPTSATEPMVPGDPAPGRLPVTVPEPDPREARPRIAFPEPQPS